MDRSYPYSRRLTRRTQLQKRLAAVAALGVAGVAVLYAMTAPSPAATAPAAMSAAFAAASAPAQADAAQAGPRRIYPYSIVRGGVSDARELRRVIREDKVVAAHYAEFDMAKAHAKTVSTPRAVHVSYRKGDKVYWTAKKVMLHEGETLLSDGTHEARARCANQISDTPRLPVEAHGPSAEELDSSIAGDNGADGGLQDVSAGMLDGQGAPGGFLNAPGSGTAGGILAGAADSGSLFASAAYVPHAPRGAFRSSGSGTGGSGTGTDSGGNGGTGTGSSGDGDSGNTGSGTPAPGSGTTGGGTPGSTTPGASPGTPSQPTTPTTPPASPGNPSGGTNPGTPGGAPSTPTIPGQPLPANPGGEQAGGGGNTVPTVPSTDGGATPSPGGNPAPGGNPGTGSNPSPGGLPATPGIPGGGPDSSPVPGPTLGGDPQEPGKPVD